MLRAIFLAALIAPTAATALQYGRPDADTIATNAVVNVAGCTGTLVRDDLVLTSGHCARNRVRPAGHDDFPHGCSDYEHPDRWYRLTGPVPVRVGRDSNNWKFTTQARTYTLPGCVDMLMLRLDTPVPDSIARPAPVLTQPHPSFRTGAPVRVVGWGLSGLDDLWSRDADTSAQSWSIIGHAHDVTAMAESGGFLYATDEADNLWRRPANQNNQSWHWISRAHDVVGMAASGGMLYAATSSDTLWRRAANNADVPWQRVGHARGVTGMTAVGDTLFVATRGNRLWARVASDVDLPWRHIGHARGITALAAWDGQIYGTTTGNTLWSRPPVMRDVPWRRVGGADRVRAMAAADGRLFAAQEPDSTGSGNTMGLRQTASATLGPRDCSFNSALERTLEICVDPAGSSRIRSGDSGGPVFWRPPGLGEFVVGVIRQDNGTTVPTFWENTADGVLGTADVGPWIEWALSN